MALAEVMQGVPVDRPVPELMISGLTHDSRKVAAGEIFLALPGLHTNGLTFVPQAIARGAVAVVGPPAAPAGLDIPYFAVNDPRQAYSRMAANFYGHPSRSMTVIGITGTNGKTTTAALLAAMLEAGRGPTATIGTLGAQWGGQAQSTGFTTPDAVTLQRLLAELQQQGTDRVVLEISSHALDQSRTDDLDFDLAVFTNFTQDHLDYHGTMEAYLEAKLKLFAMLPADAVAIVNGDDDHASAFANAAPCPVLTYGLGKSADVQVSGMGLSLERTVANITWEGQSFSIESRLIGSYNLMNLLAASAAGLALSLPAAAIQEGIRQVRAVPGRLERIASSVPGTVMIDYAHTPDAYENVLSALKILTPEGTKIAVLFGCGGDRDRTKRPLMAAVAERHADHIYVTSDNPRTEPLEQINADIVAGFSAGQHSVIADRKAALNAALSAMTPETLLLVLGKGREDYELVGTGKVPHNDVGIIESFEA
jgi:UDP-N-acetylmuramoyl-L-alanyl-D-glutamate--2,6-diaminopimelate ligase